MCATLLQYRVAGDELTGLSEAVRESDVGRVSSHADQVYGLMTIARSLLAGLSPWTPGERLVGLLRLARSLTTFGVLDIEQGLSDPRPARVERGTRKLAEARRVLERAASDVADLEATEGLSCDR